MLTKDACNEWEAEHAWQLHDALIGSNSELRGERCRLSLEEAD